MNLEQHRETQSLLVKAPVVITVYFWAIKLLVTSLGQASADFLSFNLHYGLSAGSWLISGLMLALLYVQVRTKQYIPWLFWLMLFMLSIVGILITDNLTDSFGIPLQITCLVLAIALLTTFVLWYRIEGTLSIHRIDNAKCEMLYWAAILFAFVLGMATGDLLAESQSMSYGLSLLFLSGAVGAIAIGFYVLKLNAFTTFWLAFILTGPLASNIGHYLSQPVINGGQGLGMITTSAVFSFCILGLLFFITRSRVDAPVRVEIESPELKMDVVQD